MAKKKKKGSGVVSTAAATSDPPRCTLRFCTSSFPCFPCKSKKHNAPQTLPAYTLLCGLQTDQFHPLGAQVLAAGPKAVLHALRSLATVGVASGDTYSMLRAPTKWPPVVHEDVKSAWTTLAAGGFEVSASVITATFEALRGLSLVPGFRVRLPVDSGSGSAFVRGTGKNPSLLRMRDFVDSLVLAAEATLARDAASAPLAKGKAKLPEQRALRQHLGLPAGAAVGHAKLRARDLGALLQEAGVPLSDERLAKVIALVGGPLPDVPALVRSSRQPVPYLEAERLLLASLPQQSLAKMLAQPHNPPGRTTPGRTPIPEWHDRYMAAARKAEAMEHAARASALAHTSNGAESPFSGGGSAREAVVDTGLAMRMGVAARELAEADSLPEERLPLGKSRQQLERWWLG
jgi:hypothetical protein